ncbi:hypothetical protein LVD15_04305 [Fulvivirga maritima]|uniref:hypothetical protein n=1 Tax=Fulvivirga maritima TaxID=2904247 RepID=UPI001F2EFC19|nr:hypothetical protein [Fulvivirga maritima]UII27654.1 hypothetical protein LVD15_04305 [Fulvivirga maritima]
MTKRDVSLSALSDIDTEDIITTITNSLNFLRDIFAPHEEREAVCVGKLIKLELSPVMTCTSEWCHQLELAYLVVQ